MGPQVRTGRVVSELVVPQGKPVSQQSVPSPQARPDYRPRPKDRPTPREAPVARARVTLGDELKAKLEEKLAALSDENAKAKALETAALSGVPHPEAIKRRGEIARSTRAKYLSHLGHANRALARARELRSEDDVVTHVAKVVYHLECVAKFDEERRSAPELRSFIGTSQRELDTLPDRFFAASLVAVPVNVGELEALRSSGDEASIACMAQLEPRQPREWPKGVVCRPVPETFQVAGVYVSERKQYVSGRRDVRVMRCGTATTMPQAKPPMPEVSDGQIVDPPKARIIYRPGTEYGDEPILRMPDDQLLLMKLRREQSPSRTYKVIEKDGITLSDGALVGSFSRGLRLYTEPSTECETFLLLVEQVGAERSMRVLVNDDRGLRSVSVPWDESLVTEHSHGIPVLSLGERIPSRCDAQAAKAESHASN